MLIKDYIKKRGRFIEIPNVSRNDLALFFVEMGYKHGAEIGVDKGEYTKILCNAGLKVYAIDPWENYKEYKRPGKYRTHYDVAIKNLKGYNCEIIKKNSMDALDDFKDNSIDFVYIDGNHTLPYIVSDIFGWERKIKKGGIISGHDYATIRGFSEGHETDNIYDGCHVKEGVNASVRIMKIRKVYILGEKSPEGNNWREKWRSWFWIKK